MLGIRYQLPVGCCFHPSVALGLTRGQGKITVHTFQMWFHTFQIHTTASVGSNYYTDSVDMLIIEIHEV